MEQETKPWQFRAGHLALDFTNTADWHASDNPVENLTGYDRLVQWALDFGLITNVQAAQLAEMANAQPGMAARVLEEALALREALFRIFSQIALGEQPAENDLRLLRDSWSLAASHASLEPGAQNYRLAWTLETPEMDQMLWPVATAAANLLLFGELSQVGRCADERGCGTLFMDTSRNHSRQWCSMETCGNRAKAKRHYHKNVANSGA